MALLALYGTVLVGPLASPVAAYAAVVEAVPPLGEGAAHGTLGVLRLGRLLARHHVPAGAAAGGSHHVQRAAAAAHRTHDFALKGNCRFVRHLPTSHRCTMLNFTVTVKTYSIERILFWIRTAQFIGEA